MIITSLLVLSEAIKWQKAATHARSDEHASNLWHVDYIRLFDRALGIKSRVFFSESLHLFLLTAHWNWIIFHLLRVNQKSVHNKRVESKLDES